MARMTFAPALGVALAVAVALGVAEGRANAAGPKLDVQLIGLAPLYEALFAVANCPDLALDEPAFRRAAGLYHLTSTDLTLDGPFAPQIAELTAGYRLRLEADRLAFCDVRRLQFAVPQGVLVDLDH